MGYSCIPFESAINSNSCSGCIPMWSNSMCGRFLYLLSLLKHYIILYVLNVNNFSYFWKNLIILTALLFWVNHLHLQSQ